MMEVARKLQEHQEILVCEQEKCQVQCQEQQHEEPIQQVQQHIQRYEEEQKWQLMMT